MRGIVALVALQIMATPAAAEPETWKVDEEKSPLDDSVLTGSGIHAVKGGGQFIARCMSNKTDVMLVHPRVVLGTIDAIKVSYRIDKRQAVDDLWQPLANGTGALASTPIPLLRALPETGQIFLRATDWLGRQHDAMFQFTGTGAMRDKIGKACHWGGAK